MSKIGLIMQREFQNRVHKKSFIIATILVPLIFPAIIATMVYVAREQERSAEEKLVYYVDEARLIKPEEFKKFTMRRFDGTLEDAKTAFTHSNDFGLLYIPAVSLSNPEGITFYSKQSPGPGELADLETRLENQIRDAKLAKFNIEKALLDSLKTQVSIHSVMLTESGQEKSSDSKVLFTIGMTGGILIYIFIFVYGAQIMQGVIEEKSSKVVEIIVSTVRPFQLMMGKILGLASVGLLQFLIWIVLVTTLSSLVMGFFGFEMTSMAGTGIENHPAYNSEFLEMMQTISEIPITYIVFSFLFFFLGGYLLYGALFAAVGSAVDSPAEAQQFIFPITIPMLISYFALFTFILDDPHGPVSVWLSIIPFTSPVAMIGRISFGVPLWQMIVSMVSLVGGFIFTTWVAARIYRVGILMHGSKVNYKVLTRWFLMKG